jgi:hypothetical protein
MDYYKCRMCGHIIDYYGNLILNKDKLKKLEETSIPIFICKDCYQYSMWEYNEYFLD